MSSRIITENDLRAILNAMPSKFLLGEIKIYSGSTAPSGWMICDGRAISREDYADLFDVIGTTYGSGDGSTTFNLPNLKGRVPVGVGSLDVNTTTYWGSVTAAQVNCPIGERGGEAWHWLNIAELPAHDHAYQKPVLMYGTGGNMSWGSSSGANAKGSDQWGYYGAGRTGGGGGHNNMPPYTAVNYIIRVE
jgi:microcystin-dependent protein